MADDIILPKIDTEEYNNNIKNVLTTHVSISKQINEIEEDARKKRATLKELNNETKDILCNTMREMRVDCIKLKASDDLEHDVYVKLVEVKVNPKLTVSRYRKIVFESTPAEWNSRVKAAVIKIEDEEQRKNIKKQNQRKRIREENIRMSKKIKKSDL
jgi:hypothetical protein